MSVTAQPKKKKAFKRNFDLRRIKLDMSYTPQEIGQILGIHKNTVHQWFKAGLPRIDNQKPYLVHGHDLHTFLKERQHNKRKQCKPNEIYCVKCKKPQPVWENAVDLIIYNDKQLMIQGLCVVCASKINKLGSVRRIHEYQNQFVVLQLHQPLHQPRIYDTSNPSSICDKKDISQND